MKVAFHTLGCKVNQYETEALKEQFAGNGCEIVGEEEYADVYIINTCTVTSLADRKSRQYIRRMKKQNPHSIVAVTGCYAQVSPEEVAAVAGVNIVAGTNEKSRLYDYIRNYKCTPKVSQHIREYEELTNYIETGSITSMESRTRAYIKVQEGCNRFCSYCVIPYARGKVRSRAPADILKEAEELLEKGFKELILTGINTALYGTEEGFYNPLEKQAVYGIEIIVKLLHALDGEFRIRLSSLEPTVINAEYVKRLFVYPRLCHHLHLSLQSGSDAILSAMNRRYNRAEYLEITGVLRSFDLQYGITSDLIVGFPGETEEDFRESMEMAEEAGFSRMHVFKYSNRPGTAAAKMKGHVSPEVKNRRSRLLIAASEAALKRFCSLNLGTVRQVLFEEYEEAYGCYTGYTDNYIKAYLPGSPSDQERIRNHFLIVKLTELHREGVLVEE